MKKIARRSSYKAKFHPTRGCRNRRTVGWSSLAKALGANDRISFGCIGVGGMGTGHLGTLVKGGAPENTSVAAVCDVYQKRLDRAVALSGAPGFTDYRRLLERKDIDAVLIATPDHWHSKLTIDSFAHKRTSSMRSAAEVRSTAMLNSRAPRWWRSRSALTHAAAAGLSFGTRAPKEQQARNILRKTCCAHGEVRY